MGIRDQYRKHMFKLITAFCAAIMVMVIAINVKSTRDQQKLLEDSIKSQLISICLAAQERISPEQILSYQSLDDITEDAADYEKTLAELRLLANAIEAEYIYVLKTLPDGRTVFIYDTDTEVNTVFTEYDPSDVHINAFAGERDAGLMNVSDTFGDFHTGAIPLMHDDNVIAVISADIRDHLIKNSRMQALGNSVFLLVMLALMMGLMLHRLYSLLRIKKVHKTLEKAANHDVLTGLPNRKYLIDYLEQITTQDGADAFALLFIDLDNFKTVNDMAGHDAGDAVLRHVAEYLQNSSASHSISFRPAAGALNIAARVGGDEFIQIIQGITTEAEAVAVASELLSGFRQSGLDRYIDKFNVGMSIGIALYPYHTDNYHVLIKYADIAMYHAKHSGKNNYSVYQDEMQPKAEK